MAAKNNLLPFEFPWDKPKIFIVPQTFVYINKYVGHTQQTSTDDYTYAVLSGSHPFDWVTDYPISLIPDTLFEFVLDHNREPRTEVVAPQWWWLSWIKATSATIASPSSRRGSVRFSMIYRFGGPLQRINKMNDWRIDKEMEYINWSDLCVCSVDEEISAVRLSLYMQYADNECIFKEV